MYSYRIITAMLKHDGYPINRKRVQRIWRQEGLQLPRRKVVKRRFGDSTGMLRRASHPNEVWTYDFLEARTERGSKLRMLTILDEYTRECLTIYVARSISSRQVIQQLEWLVLLRGAPDYLRSDNGPEFIAYHSSSGCGTGTAKRCTSPRAVPGKIPSSRASTGHFAAIA